MEFEKELCNLFLTNDADLIKNFSKLLNSVTNEHLAKLQYLPYGIPFESLKSVVEDFLEKNGLPALTAIPSNFIHPDCIKCLVGETRFPNNSEKCLFERLMQDIFVREGKISNYERLMGHFPIYLEKHIEVMKKMFNNDLSIPNEWRYYIAYMAAATHKCEYLMKHEKKLCKLFYQDWLDANQVPDKLKSLGNANVKLAHRPWEFTHEDIKELLSYWNTKELVLALAILCQFHCLSGFVFGIGVAPETIQHRSLLNEPQHLQKTGKTIKTNIVSALKNYSESQEPENEILDSSFEDIPGNEEEIYYSKAAGGYLSYANYDMDTATKHFNASDFKFSDQAYYIIEKIIPEVSESIWNRIRTTFAMTYEHLGGESGVKTKLLRRAIWNYVQRVYGLQYDDFCYTIINKFLHINTKRYIKKVACFPDTVVQEDYENIKLKITDDEMIHLNLIICEARFEAQLVYMLHALQRALDLN